MINIILILLALHFLRTYIYKIKYTTLNCGIFAYGGKNASSFDKAKFDIQGLFNNSRGGDSCGVSTDGEIYYGIQTSKNYGPFLVNSNYEAPKFIPTVIGHTRKSSSGTINADNAHPFGFGDYNDSFEFIGVHNGTLHNQTDLAKKYGIETSVYKYNANNVWTYDRTKIDSEILLEILYITGNFEVLSDYIGGAALIWSNTMEPNVLYAFRGASRMEKHGAHVNINERPLYYYIEDQNNVYISSMQESLTAIGGEANQTLFKMDENTVYKITDGDIQNAEKFLISREEAHQKPNYSYTSTVSHNVNANYYKNNNKNKNKKDRSKLTTDLVNIRLEKSEKFYPSDIYMQNLRYRRNGHVVTGIFTWIDKYGLLRLTDDSSKVIKETQSIIGKYFDMEDGFFIHNEEGVDLSAKNIILPFNERVKPAILYIYNGILMETETDYNVCKNTNTFFSVVQLSEMSKHPIINIHAKFGVNDQQIWHKSKLHSGNISPLGVNKIYYIENGNLIKTELVEVAMEIPEFEPVRPILSLLPINTANITEQNDESFIDQLVRESIEEKNQLTLALVEEENSDCSCELSTDPSIGMEKVQDLMLPIYMKVQEANDELENYKTNPVIRNIIDTNTDYLTTLDEDIEKLYLKN